MLVQDRTGGLRIQSPRKTIAQVEAILDERLAIHIQWQDLSSLGLIQHPVFMAHDPEKRFVGMGKGLTSSHARASSLMELIERSAARRHASREILRTPYRDVCTVAVSPRSLLHGAQPDWTEASPTDFVQGWSLLSSQSRWVPASFAYMAYNCELRDGTLKHIRDSIRVLSGTNGLASGNCLEEALLHGLYEVIERDALFTAWLTRQPAPDFCLDHLHSPGLEEMVEQFRNAGIDLHAKYLPSGLPDVHVAFCYAFSRQSRQNDGPAIAYGCGAHADPLIALTRALCELTQIAVSIRIQRRSLNHPIYLAKTDAAHRQNIVNFCNLASVRHFDFFNDTPMSCPMLRIDDLANEECDDIGHEVRRIVGRLHSQGYEAFAVDLTDERLGVPVVRVLVPGFQPPVRKECAEIYTDRMWAASQLADHNPTRLNSFELL